MNPEHMAMKLKPRPNHLIGSVQKSWKKLLISVKCEGFSNCFLQLQWRGASWILATRPYGQRQKNPSTWIVVSCTEVLKIFWFWIKPSNQETFTYLHKWSLQLYRQDCDLAAQDIYVVGVNVIYEWRDLCGQIWATDVWKTFHGNRIQSSSFCQKSPGRMSPKIYFFIFCFVGTVCTSNAPHTLPTRLRQLQSGNIIERMSSLQNPYYLTIIYPCNNNKRCNKEANMINNRRLKEKQYFKPIKLVTFLKA